MARYDEDIAGAQEAIRDDGMPVVWVQTLDPVNAGDEVMPTTGFVPVEHPARMVFFPIGLVTARSLSYRFGTDVPIGSEYGLLAGGIAFEPSLRDYVIRGTETLTIAHIDKLAPNGQAVLYTVYFNVG